MRKIELICSYDWFLSFIKLIDMHIGKSIHLSNSSSDVVVFKTTPNITEYDRSESLGIHDKNTCIIFKVCYSYKPHNWTKKVVFTGREWKLIKHILKLDEEQSEARFNHGLLFIEQFYHNQQNLLKNSHNKRKLYRRIFYASRRYCTNELKIQPIDKFLSTHGNVDLLIGLNSDEENDREGNWEMMKNVNYRYPLVEDGLDRQDCINKLKEYGLEPNFPVYMSRGGCRKCFFRTKKHARAKYYFDKVGFMEDMAFEENFNVYHLATYHLH